MKKFIKGSYEIKDNIPDLNFFVEKHRKEFEYLISYANKSNIGFNIGTSNKGDILCEYKVVGQSLKECKAAMSEFKRMLKAIFKKVNSLYEGSGDQIF